jgi:hypothetical protein
MKRVPSGELFVFLRKNKTQHQTPKRRGTAPGVFRFPAAFPVFSPLSGPYTHPPAGLSRHPKNKSLELSHSPVNSREK